MSPSLCVAAFERWIGFLFLLDALCLWKKFDLFFGPRTDGHTWFNAPGRNAAGITFWIVCATVMMTHALGDAGTLLAAAGFCVLHRHLYVSHRVTSVLGGAGAVGYMSYVVAALGCVLQALVMLGETPWDPGYYLLTHTLAAFRVLMGGILIISAVYKWKLGYGSGEGIEYALVNPMWSRFSAAFYALPHGTWWLRGFSRTLPGLHALSGILLIIPATQQVGAGLFFLAFLGALLLIHTAILPGVMMGIATLYYWLPDAAVTAPSAVHLAGAVTLWGLAAASVGLMVAQIFLVFGGMTLTPAGIVRFDRVFHAIPLFTWAVFTQDICGSYLTCHVAPAPAPEEFRPDFWFHHHEASMQLNTIFSVSGAFHAGAQVQALHHMLRHCRALHATPHPEVMLACVVLQKGATHFSRHVAWRAQVNLQTSQVVMLQQ